MAGVRSGWCEPVVIGSLFICCGSLPASAENPTAVETRVVADYRVDLDNFNLGSFRFTSLLNGSDYRVRGDGHFSMLVAFFLIGGPLPQAQGRSRALAQNQRCIH
jgi:hypothetical protein